MLEYLILSLPAILRSMIIFQSLVGLSDPSLQLDSIVFRLGKERGNEQSNGEVIVFVLKTTDPADCEEHESRGIVSL